MASSSFLSFLFLLSLLAAVCSARPGLHFHPCKTLFISYTFSSEETHKTPSSTQYFAIYRILRPLPIIINHPRPSSLPDHVRSDLSFGMSSLHERANDILLVVAGLLFGVGCGILTGAILYLVWSLFTNRYQICRSGFGEDEEEENPKKMGYFMIADPLFAKEGYEGH